MNNVDSLKVRQAKPKIPVAKPPAVQVVKVIGEQTTETMEILVDSIRKIAAAMESINKTSIKRSTIVTLIHFNSKVPKRDVELVLNNLEDFALRWLK